MAEFHVRSALRVNPCPDVIPFLNDGHWLDCSSILTAVQSSSPVARGIIVVGNVGIFGVFLRVLAFPPILIPPTFSTFNPPTSFISRHHSTHSWLGKIVGLAHHQCIIMPAGFGGEAGRAPCALPFYSEPYWATLWSMVIITAYSSKSLIRILLMIGTNGDLM